MLGLLLTAQHALAATHTEIGDAPSLPPGQTPAGSGALTSISGVISAGDREDVYRICVTGSFSATTAGGAMFDTQLFLFEDDGKSSARSKVANDDSSGTAATLPIGATPLTNGGTLSYSPGVYYLAFSSFNNDPVDASGNLIFPNSSFNGVYGPNLGVGPLAGWTGVGGQFGPYTITLTGATIFAAGNDDDTICGDDDDG